MTDSDLDITVGCEAVHPNQRGGQHVAMACTGVRITHKPTGISVLCNSERSQHGNRVKAMEMLRERLREGGQSQPVCSTCNDTHRMTLNGTVVACTRCPVPCQACRQGGTGAFCETTPCACDCHKRKAGV